MMAARLARPPFLPLAAVRFIAAAAMAISLFFPGAARAAFQPPPLNGHVVDMSGRLSLADMAYLDSRFEAFRRHTGFAIVALVVPSLNGETIEDVAYTAFKAWEIGDKGKDNGVLIAISTVDRKVRIETGMGVGGALTDLQSNDIIRGTMAPLLREGRLRDAIDAGAGKIEEALVQGTPGGGTGPTGPPRAKPISIVQIGVFAGVALVVIVLLIVSPTFRSIFGFLLQMIFFFGGRGGGGFGGGGGGGSGYSGGGGRSGGGGSSDSY